MPPACARTVQLRFQWICLLQLRAYLSSRYLSRTLSTFVDILWCANQSYAAGEIQFLVGMVVAVWLLST